MLISINTSPTNVELLTQFTKPIWLSLLTLTAFRAQQGWGVTGLWFNLYDVNALHARFNLARFSQNRSRGAGRGNAWGLVYQRTRKLWFFRTGPDHQNFLDRTFQKNGVMKRCQKHATVWLCSMLMYGFFLSLYCWVFLKCWLYKKDNLLGEGKGLTDEKLF